MVTCVEISGPVEATVPLMFCETCRKYRSPGSGRVPAFCDVCGRELFVLSIGFLVLDVISNLAYYGVHRPVLGWTLLTLAGLCLTASGIVFQLRRGQVRGFVAGVRATLAEWD